MSIKTIFKNAVLVMALMCLTLSTAWAQNETKVFSNSDIAAGSTNQLNYDGNLFICATGEATVSKANYNPYNIVMRAPYQQEGTLRLYPRISGKVKSIVFSSAYMFADEGYMKIGKGSTWTNSISEKNEGNNPWKSFEFTNADGIQLDNESDYLEIKLYHATKNGSFFTKGSITINYEPTTSTLTHNHNFSYNKNGSTLTATCAHDDGMDCSLASDDWQISTTLTPPTHATYAQYWYHPATLSNISEFTVETGATAGNITYVNNTTNENLGTSMPYEVGNYTANVTITAGGANYTLTTSYSVGTFCGINTNYPQFTTDKEGNYAVSGETVTLTFTSLYGETLTEVSAKGATSNNNITLTPTGINTYTFTMPTEEVNINATFEVPITINSNNGGSVTASVGENTNVTKAQSGETVTLTATPDEGYSVTNIHVYNSNEDYTVTNNGDGTYSFTMPANAVTVEVEFSSTIGALTISHFGDRTTATIDGSSNSSISISDDIIVDEVTYTRTFESGSYTVMLPFGFTVDGTVNGKFYTLKSIDPISETVSEAKMSDPIETVEANKPYIFVPDAAITEIKISGKKTTLKSTVGAPLTKVCANTNWKLHGVYDRKVWTDEDVNLYGFAATAIDGISAGEFVHFVTGASLKPTRCYLEYSKDGFSKSTPVLPEKIIVVFPDETSSVVEPGDPDDNSEITTPTAEITPNSGIKVWSADGLVIIEAQPDMDYTIVDLSGRILKNGVTHSTRETVTLSRRAAGIVIVKIGNQTFKVQY